MEAHSFACAWSVAKGGHCCVGDSLPLSKRKGGRLKEWLKESWLTIAARSEPSVSQNLRICQTTTIVCPLYVVSLRLSKAKCGNVEWLAKCGSVESMEKICCLAWSVKPFSAWLRKLSSRTDKTVLCVLLVLVAWGNQKFKKPRVLPEEFNQQNKSGYLWEKKIFCKISKNCLIWAKTSGFFLFFRK